MNEAEDELMLGSAVGAGVVCMNVGVEGGVAVGVGVGCINDGAGVGCE